MIKFNCFLPSNKIYAINKVIEDINLLDEREYTIKITTKRKDRSLNQNAYYWGVVIKMISDYTGHSDTEVHDALKLNFLRHHCDNLKLDSVKSTADLTTVDFEDYIARCRMFALDTLNVSIPLPNEIN